MDKIMEKVRDIGATIAEILVSWPIYLVMILPLLAISLLFFWLIGKGSESITAWWLSLWGM